MTLAAPATPPAVPTRRPRRRRRRDGPLSVARVIPAGRSRAAGQRQWLAEVRAHPDTGPLRADAWRNLVAVAEGLAAYAGWTTMTTRPTWAKLQERAGLSRRTVAKWLAWLRARELLAIVSGGTTSAFSPGVLLAGGDAEASVYVLLVASPVSLVADPEQGFRTPSRSPEVTSPARARGEIRNLQACPADRPGPVWPALQRPAGKQERRQAAEELQRRLPPLRRISAAYVAALCREHFLAGWTVSDVVHALDHGPGGAQHWHTADVRHVPGWVRSRLDAWRTDPADPRSPLRRSPGQQAEGERTRLLALARARAERAAAERAAASTPAHARRWADQCRAALRSRRAQPDTPA